MGRPGLIQKKVKVKTKRGTAMRNMWVKATPKSAGRKSLKSRGPMTAGQMLKKHGLGIAARGAATGAATLGGMVAGVHIGRKMGGYNGGELGAVIGSFGASHAATRALYGRTKNGRAIIEGMKNSTTGAKLTAAALHTTSGLATHLGGMYAAHKLSKRRQG